MQEKSDLFRLAELARLASPSHRRSTPKHDSTNIVENNGPIVRCVCKQSEISSDMIQCTICKCMSHSECINGNEIEDPDKWICPFCLKNLEEINNLQSLGTDVPEMHRAIRNCKATGHYEEIITSAKNVSDASTELHKAGRWIETVAARDDVYQLILNTANSCIDGDISDDVIQELQNERDLMNDISSILHNLAEETQNVNTPILDGIMSQIKTHPL